MKAVLKYAQEMGKYLHSHPIESGLPTSLQPLPLSERDRLDPQSIEQLKN
jgi:hypothetical protein